MKPYQHKVQYYETDKMGIVHHSNYIRWMEEARVDFLDQLGWGFEKLEEMGIVSPVSAIQCRYKFSAVFPEIVMINVQLQEFKGVKMKLSYEMRKEDGTLVCEAYSEHGFLDKEGKIISIKRECPELFEVLTNLIK